MGPSGICSTASWTPISEESDWVAAVRLGTLSAPPAGLRRPDQALNDRRKQGLTFPRMESTIIPDPRNWRVLFVSLLPPRFARPPGFCETPKGDIT